MSDAPSIGDNAVAKDRLLSIVQRYEQLDEEKKALSSDQKDILTEAKSAGFDTKALRRILQLRKMDAGDMEEQQTLIDVYMRALNMQPDLFDGAEG